MPARLARASQSRGRYFPSDKEISVGISIEAPFAHYRGHIRQRGALVGRNMYSRRKPFRTIEGFSKLKAEVLNDGITGQSGALLMRRVDVRASLDHSKTLISTNVSTSGKAAGMLASTGASGGEHAEHGRSFFLPNRWRAGSER